VPSEYKLSGALGTLPIVGPLIAIPACFVLALVYSYIDVYNPLVYLTGLAWVGYMIALVAILSFVRHVSKCRNRAAMLGLGLLVGGISLYFNWVCFCHAFLGMIEGFETPGLMVFLTDPAAVKSLAGEIKENGWYEIFGTQPRGMFLLVIWIVEGAGIVGAGLMGGHLASHEVVFCEGCGVWAEEVDLGVRLVPPAEQSTLDQAIAGDVSVLLGLAPSDPLSSPHLGLNFNVCPRCQQTITLDFDRVELSLTNKGELKTDTSDLSPVFVLTPTQLASFKKLAESMPDVPAEPEDEPLT
jgi:hypothetical protein